MSDELSDLAHFSGVARLFPLPNLVLFPHVVQPLHIFEPRYRQLTADALVGDRLLAITLLQPGWERDYEGRPALHPVACLGRIVADQRLADGRYNLLLRGLGRIRIEQERDTGKLYRTADVTLLTDQALPTTAEEQILRKRLAGVLPSWIGAHPAFAEQFRTLLESNLPLSALCDVFTFALPLEMEFKQQLLETLNVEERVRRLLRHLAAHAPAMEAAGADRPFPPGFSTN
jgi:Lon protease-like protein